MTTLCDHIENNNIDGVRRLIKKGIDLNKIDDFEFTPLHMAVNCGNLGIIELLIIEGADVNKIDKDGIPPLLCIGGGDEQILKMLLEYGANPNIKDKNGRTALDQAYEGNMVDFVQLLLSYGAKSTIKPSDFGLSDGNYI